jgi:hypothetical protein
MQNRHNEKKRVRGIVDRITGGIVVVLVRHPDDPEVFQEIYVPREKFKQAELNEGDQVSISL